MEVTVVCMVYTYVVVGNNCLDSSLVKRILHLGVSAMWVILSSG